MIATGYGLKLDKITFIIESRYGKVNQYIDMGELTLAGHETSYEKIANIATYAESSNNLGPFSYGNVQVLSGLDLIKVSFARFERAQLGHL